LAHRIRKIRACGFADQSHFTWVFTRVAGPAPGDEVATLDLTGGYGGEAISAFVANTSAPAQTPEA